MPTNQEFLDIVLSRTQRQLPTQIRAGFKISRIRGMADAAEFCVDLRTDTMSVQFPALLRRAVTLTKILCATTGFYTRKVKYTQETFCEKFQAILDGFPRLQDIHPFRMLF